MARQLPPLFIAYLADPSDSGKIHNDVRRRFDSGDTAVHEAMATFASYTDKARVAIEAGNTADLADLMDQNFESVLLFMIGS